ncbi:MmcQ/YjbR family DNA-binding protein [Photobacterium japonica]|uniref:MmcQ/YjbR family DNA-binding protein n=1 Tax=Photobacterium japonica TaxID=2910235 RepID=UPI003D0DFA0F
MEHTDLVDYLAQLPESDSSYPFGPDAEVFKVSGKMFALVAHYYGEWRVTLKGTPVDNIFLAEQFKGIMPGYHMNKQHWITVSLEQDVSGSMICDLAKQSYALVVSKLPKGERTRLQMLEWI